MTGYYCRFCDNFIREDETKEEVQSLLHDEVDTRSREMYLVTVCPDCGYELIERADDCICGEMKLEADHLCRSCKKLAKEEWESSIESLRKQTGCDNYDSTEIMETYVEHYVF